MYLNATILFYFIFFTSNHTADAVGVPLSHGEIIWNTLLVEHGPSFFLEDSSDILLQLLIFIYFLTPESCSLSLYVHIPILPQ